MVHVQGRIQNFIKEGEGGFLGIKLFQELGKKNFGN